jgi:ATP-dependent DNA helicase RecG
MENQSVEYKESWRDEYLKWVCGFANASGGRIFIGFSDKGDIIGINNHQKLMEDIPNKTIAHLGLVIDVNLHFKDGKNYLEIMVPSHTVPISYHGIYYYRSGNTKQELKGTALQHFLLRKIGKSWEDIPVPSATLDDLDKTTIHKFLEKAIEKGRVPTEAINDSVVTVLEKLNLITKDGQLTNAAILLFGKNPYSISATTSFKIGRFGKEPHDLRFQDIIETNLFIMADKVMEKLNDKYLVRPITYKGLERVEPLEYPESALREALLNAIIHKDYSSTWIFLRVYDNKLEIWNPGNLPEELTIEKLKEIHSSYPRNPNIAGVFFKAGYIESWGRGINKIINACIEAGLPEPVINEDQGGIRVTFIKDIYTEQYLKTTDLNERQVKAVLFISQEGSIDNTRYQKLNNIGKTLSTRELQELVNMGLIKQVGTAGRGIKYVLIHDNL